MRLLSIGNSFSTDAHRWLAQCSASAGEYLYAANLFIGGCPLKRHWNEYLSSRPAYRLEINGESIRWTTLHDALFCMGEWDVITLQQVSGHSGMVETFEPYLSRLVKLVREAQPKARILIHKTWSYEIDCTLDGFQNYNCSQREMYNALTAAYNEVSEKYGIDLIEAGTFIQHLRDNVPAFDYAGGGMSLNRDGFHLSLLYGRYAAALIWYAKLFSGDVTKVRFVPPGADESVISLIRDEAVKFLNPKY